MMYREPSDSPWGVVVRCDTLCTGVYSVSTAGHGGIMVQTELGGCCPRRPRPSAFRQAGI